MVNEKKILLIHADRSADEEVEDQLHGEKQRLNSLSLTMSLGRMMVMSAELLLVFICSSGPLQSGKPGRLHPLVICCGSGFK